MPRSSARHVRLRDLGRAARSACSARATASASSLSTMRSSAIGSIFASEAKALLPFLPEIETDPDALAEYLTFQYTHRRGRPCSAASTQLLAGSRADRRRTARSACRRYWDVHYEIDFDHSPRYFERRLVELLDDSVELHLRSDVPVGAYVSGGIDSSLVAILAARRDARHCGLLSRALHRIPRLRRERIRAQAAVEQAARSCTRSTSPPATFATTYRRRASTISIFRWPARAPFRNSWSRSSPRAT